jgi:hypothetical protein
LVRILKTLDEVSCGPIVNVAVVAGVVVVATGSVKVTKTNKIRNLKNYNCDKNNKLIISL